MKLTYSQPNIAQGRLNQQQGQETPNTFGMLNSAEQLTQTSRLDRPKQRFAGQLGQRYVEYMNNPEEQARTDMWMQAFGQSNEGMQFNQAKMNQGAQQQQQQEQEQA